MVSSKITDPYLIDEETAPLSEEEIKQLRPAPDVFKELGLPIPPHRRGRPKSDAPKTQITLRLDADIIDHFRESGKGWQTRLNDTLRQIIDGRD